MNTNIIDARIRRFLLLLAALILVGTVFELWLTEHTEELAQWIPFILSGIGFVAILAVLINPQRRTILALRVAMLMLGAGGLVGIGLHLINNYEFEQEIRPTLQGLDLIVEALKGANPLIAPGILVFAALVALIATYYHPLLQQNQ